MATTQHTRCLKWNHVGKRSTNGGLFAWAKREFKRRTNHHMRTHCDEFKEWEQERLLEREEHFNALFDYDDGYVYILEPDDYPEYPEDTSDFWNPDDGYSWYGDFDEHP